jgi:parallel beta-helix repeat protein
LLGDDVECTGNKVTGGGVQIVVHDMTGTTVSLRNYVISGNMLWDSKATAITINQNSATYGNNSNQQIVVSNNNIYSPALTGISVVGAYAGSGATLGSTVISGNTVVDGLTNNLVPEAAAGISLLGTVNTVVDSNVIISPRWAGIMAYYDGSNISISNNIITDHQGRTSTGGGTSTPQAGAPIFINGGAATVAIENVNVTGNIISNYATAVSPQAEYIRTGGIVVSEAKTKDISIKNNRIMDGNTVGISVLSAINVIIESNEVTGFYSKALLAQTPGLGCQFTYAISGARYDTTANRPILESVQGGYQYWDTSLTKPIWWNGSVWKDASNVTV